MHGLLVSGASITITIAHHYSSAQNSSCSVCATKMNDSSNKQAYFPFRSMLRWCPMGSRVPSTVYWPSSLQVSNWTAALKGLPNKTPLTLCSFFNHPRNWLHCSECPPHIIKRQAASWDGKLCLWDGLPPWTMENWSFSAEDACWFPEWDAWIAKR